jgi:hypothetical protein
VNQHAWQTGTPTPPPRLNAPVRRTLSLRYERNDRTSSPESPDQWCPQGLTLGSRLYVGSSHMCALPRAASRSSRFRRGIDIPARCPHNVMTVFASARRHRATSHGLGLSSGAEMTPTIWSWPRTRRRGCPASTGHYSMACRAPSIIGGRCYRRHVRARHRRITTHRPHPEQGENTVRIGRTERNRTIPTAEKREPQSRRGPRRGAWSGRNQQPEPWLHGTEERGKAW